MSNSRVSETTNAPLKSLDEWEDFVKTRYPEEGHPLPLRIRFKPLIRTSSRSNFATTDPKRAVASKNFIASIIRIKPWIMY